MEEGFQESHIKENKILYMSKRVEHNSMQSYVVVDSESEGLLQ